MYQQHFVAYINCITSAALRLIHTLYVIQRLSPLKNHLLLEMFKFHILDLLFGFSFVKTLFILLI